ncbi:MAG: hypothetical protein INR81_07930 [Microcystis aeruginosa PMC 728.11]|nr:hypothetical protein [Microcystis aeruginosa PMC 728.11]
MEECDRFWDVKGDRFLGMWRSAIAFWGCGEGRSLFWDDGVRSLFVDVGGDRLLEMRSLIYHL